MRLGPVTKIDNITKTTSKKFNDDVILENYDVIAIFSIYSQFGATWKSNSVKRIFLLIVTFYLTKTENRTKKSLTQLSHYCFG